MKSYQDLIAWQKGMALVAEVYRVSNTGGLRRDWGLRNQLSRSSVSVPSNVAEGYERGGRREFARGLTFAKGSCGEVRTQLLVAVRAGLLSESDARPALMLAEEPARILAALRAAVRRQEDHPD
ncbi:MAG TPA: four helix bundle protein [Gemmatimonadales bacterium]|nr:four helix bundle protein [Gemmatimonadales bacterium]